MESLMIWESFPGGGAPGTNHSFDDLGEDAKVDVDEDEADADEDEDEAEVDEDEDEHELRRMDSAVLLLRLHSRMGRAWERSSRLGPATRSSLMVRLWCYDANKGETR
jgi:hypothetical protein